MVDASAEGAKTVSSLRARGYEAFLVPLQLLVSRVAVQRPSLIICNIDFSGALAVAQQVRDVPGTRGVRAIYVGEPGRTLNGDTDAGFHEGNAFLPSSLMGDDALAKKVVELIGAPPRPAQSTGHPEARSHPPADSAPPGSRRTLHPARVSGPPEGERADSAPSVPSAPKPAAPASDGVQLQRGPPSGAGAELTREHGAARRVGIASISPKLAQLLQDAEARVSTRPLSGRPSSPVVGRLTPDEEVEAVLPEDVLAALEQPLALDDDLDDFEDPAPRPTQAISEPESSAGSVVAGASTGSGTGSDSEYTSETVAHASRHHSQPARTVAERPRSEAAPVSAPEAPGSGPGAEPPTLPPLTRHRRPTPLSDQGPLASVAATSADLPPADATHRLGPATLSPPTEPPSSPWPGPRTTLAPETVAASSARLDSGRGGADASPWAPPRTPPLPHPRPAARAPMLPAAGESSLPPASADPESVRLPPGRGPTRPPSYEPNPRAATPRIPSSLGKGDVVRAIARAIRARFTGALALEDSAGIRRIVFREGDFVTVASGAEQESLVAFLTERGDLPPEAARLERKLPAFGKHAGAALVAHGHLRQDELWPVLRAHAEWLMARSLIVDRCAASLEKQIPARLHAEPLVFGGATGAEVLVEVARRVIAPEQAILRLLGPDARLQKGPEWPLLSECNLMDRELEAVLAAPGSTVSELVARVGDAGFATALYILAELEILSSSRGPEAQPEARSRSVPYDPLDEVAIRTRIETRRALVEEGDYFALLGVGRNATGYEIRRAYLGLRREYAPETLLTAKTADLREDLDLVLEVLDEAYEILHDDARRNRYRRALEASQG